MEGFVFYLKEARRSQVHNGSMENDSIICPLKEALVAPKALFKLKPVKGGGAQGSLESYEKSGVRFPQNPISLPRPHPWPCLHLWDDPVVGPYRWGLNAALHDSGLSVPEKALFFHFCLKCHLIVYPQPVNTTHKTNPVLYFSSPLTSAILSSMTLLYRESWTW